MDDAFENIVNNYSDNYMPMLVRKSAGVTLTYVVVVAHLLHKKPPQAHSTVHNEQEVPDNNRRYMQRLSAK